MKKEKKIHQFVYFVCVKYVTVDDLKGGKEEVMPAGLAIVAIGSLLQKKVKSHPSPLFAVNFLQKWTLSLSLWCPSLS